jgi:hypothetical protein
MPSFRHGDASLRPAPDLDGRLQPGGPPITAQDGWPTYTADHIALLDHLQIAH